MLKAPYPSVSCPAKFSASTNGTAAFTHSVCTSSTQPIKTRTNKAVKQQENHRSPMNAFLVPSLAGLCFLRGHGTPFDRPKNNHMTKWQKRPKYRSQPIGNKLTCTNSIRPAHQINGLVSKIANQCEAVAKNRDDR